ncbi:acyl-CoA thioester hydrolase/BAAT C-terminal domain-containing protein [Caulobacter mirabilis]|uniref:Dienelactone hydrolase n=1 Tax=Caulobacter mirabilis TaxID=69666 RepID=A0A2D2B1G9_9CAUL|nr:acyl-CoA thioester hydrolase/BAAT C-terminal domain-containing protein [Caulobacter mirabilis]ATQ44057.1 dienelactone hydrolase [Caulobacter mirabilis]
MRFASIAVLAIPAALAGPVMAQPVAEPAPAAAASTPAAATPRPPTTKVREEGLVADYFAAEPSQAKRGSVIVLGGSEGGLVSSRGIARQLAAQGFDAIAVSYFGEAGQPPRLDLIPIETVGRARAWLEARPGHGGRIGVVGVSKGAELALLVASRDPRIQAVAVGVPSHVLWQGIDMTGGPTGSSWTAEGKPLAYVPYDLSQGFQGVHKLYVDSLKSAKPEAEIAVERIAGPVLMISDSSDRLWPSAEMAGKVEARLKARGFRHPVVNLVYKDAGHMPFGPPVRRDASWLQQALFFGGTADGVVAARADSWPRVVDFLAKALAAE